MRYQAQRGTEDVLPNQSHVWQHVQSVFQDLVHNYGYRELRTPTFEDTDLFVRSSGETSEVVSKQMYSFLDKGDRNITLKPEGTAPAMRAVIEHNLCPPGTVQRLWYFTPIFRYERPQKGRLREAHQVGLELIGSNSPLADAEVVEITVAFYRALGVEDAIVRLNSIGRSECRARFREAILAKVSGWLADQDQEARAKVEKNPLRLLDSKDPGVHAALAGLAPVTDFLEDESRERFDQLQTALTEAGVPFVVDPGIVRGLDYYTETVFEVQSDRIGAQSALCGGGRYDNLVKELGGAPTPSVGVAMGVERAILVLEEMGRLPTPPPLDAFVVAATESAASVCRRVAADLRSAGLSATLDFEGRKMGAQLKQADRLGATYAILLGDDELAAGTATVRHLASSRQWSVARADLATALRAPLPEAAPA